MEKIDFTMNEIKVVGIASAGFVSSEFLDSILILGQPYISGLIGILTVIYLIKKIFTKSIKNVGFSS